jgi:hypothetical protein
MSDAQKGHVRRPIQLDLTVNDRRFLEEVAAAPGLSATEVLRRGLRRMAGEILSDSVTAVAHLSRGVRSDCKNHQSDVG